MWDFTYYASKADFSSWSDKIYKICIIRETFVWLLSEKSIETYEKQYHRGELLALFYP